MAVHEDRSELRERPVGELVKQLSDQFTTLLHQEIELAKVELTAKGKLAGIGAGMLGAAALFAVLALGTLTAAAVLALATAVDAWLAAVIVAVAYLAVAGVLAMIGKSRAQAAGPPVPERTVESVREDLEYTKARVKEARS
jgi:uncharacterized membrane protein YqjE